HADAAAVLAAELPERDRLLVSAQLGRELRGHVPRLHAALRVPYRDGVRVVLVLGLPDEREPATRREGVVLQLVETVRRAGELHDVEALVVPAHRSTGRRIAQPVAGRAALEPQAQPLGHRVKTR